MKQLWCWRCQREMPMLDAHEMATVVAGPYKTRAELAREYPGLNSQPDAFMAKLFEPQLARFEAITGYHETNFNAVWHHRWSIYGPPCPACGKPFRTPKAKFCAACG